MPRRLLFVGHDASRSGAVIFLLHFLRWLKRRHPEVSFSVLLRRGGSLAGEFSALAPTFVLKGIFDPHSLPGRAAKHSLAAQRLIARARRLRLRLFFGGGLMPDVIYSNTATNGWAVDDLAAIRGMKRPRVITHLHEMEFTIRHHTDPGSFAKVEEQTDMYIAASEAVRRDVLKHHTIPESKVAVIHEFVPAHKAPVADAGSLRAQFREQHRIPPSAFVVAGCGTVGWRKGTDLLVPLLIALRKRLPDAPVCFLWIGCDASDPNVIRLRYDSEQAGVAEHLRLIDVQADLSAGYAAADVFALLSREDPFPLVCLEAAAAGKPIVCFADAGGMPEFVESDSGIVVPFLDLAAMAEALAHLYEDPSERDRFGARALEKVRERHDLESNAPRLWSLVAGEMQLVCPSSQQTAQA